MEAMLNFESECPELVDDRAGYLRLIRILTGSYA